MSSFCISNILARVTTILLIGNLSIAAFVPSTLSLSSSSSLFSPLRPHDSQRLPRFATIVGDIDPDHPLLTVIQPQNQPLVKNLQNSNIRAFDIPNNSTLHLKCTGNREIVWAFPQNYEQEGYRIENLADISHSCLSSGKPSLTSSRGSRTCVTEFILKETSYDQTGLFACHYNDTQQGSLPSSSSQSSSSTSTSSTSSKSETQISRPLGEPGEVNARSSVYIFVNDEHNLLVPTFAGSFIFIQVVQSNPATIPCKPTSSSVNVTLWKVHPNTGEMEQLQISPDLGSYFDPTIGFHFDRLRWNAESSLLRCVAVMGPVKEVFEVNIHWSIDPGLLHPIINYDEARFVTVNSSFSLLCSVRVEVGVLIPAVHWEFPTRIGSRVTIDEIHSSQGGSGESGNSFVIYSRKLTVQDVRKSDEGIYSCHVESATGKHFSVSHFVKVLASQYQSFVNLSTDFYKTENTALERSVGEEVQFVVNVEAYPNISSVTLVWYKDDKVISEVKNVPIFSETGSSSNSNRNQVNDETSHFMTGMEGSQAILRIKSVTMKDTGIYTLVGNTSDNSMTSSASVILHVVGKPLIEIRNGQKYYLVDQSYSLFCDVFAYPPAKSWWRWLPCSPDSCLFTSNEWIDVDGVENRVNDAIETHINNQTSQLNVTAQQSGIYSCHAQNEKATTSENELFIVTDAENGFQIEASTQDPVENETISLTCRASPFRFTNLSSLGWEFEPLIGRMEGIKLFNDSHTQIVDGTTKYSIQSVLLIPQAKFSDSGTYSCMAYEHGSDSAASVLTKEWTIARAEAPQFQRSNLNESKSELESTSPFNLICQVTGRPKPKITWLRNGIPLNQSSGIEISDGGQQLVITRVAATDTGRYDCIASNIVNTVSRFQFLKVISPDDVNRASSIVIAVVFVVIGVIFVYMAVYLGRKIRDERNQKQEMDFFSANLFDQGQPELFNPDMPLDEQVELLPYDRRWEFPRDRLKLGKTLGQGAFGRVVKAEAIGLDEDEESTTVAVKMLKERADLDQKRALIAELKILIHLGRHLNIVNLLAACTAGLVKGELLVIVEYCAFGNLRHFLLENRQSFVNQIDPISGKVDSSIMYPKKSIINEYVNVSNTIRPNDWNQGSCAVKYTTVMHAVDDDEETDEVDVQVVQPNWKNDTNSSDSVTSVVRDLLVTTCDLICYAFQVARGMEYLSSRKLIHRDLAARNVLLADDKVVKICDFGLAKDCKYEEYVKKGDGPLPVKWMAVESIRDKVFNTKSDVWSFAILCWEFFSLGGTPYPGMEVDEEFYKKLKYGYRMEKPEYCPDFFWEHVIKRCWDGDPNKRPNFTELSDILGDFLEASVRQHYIDLNDPYQEMNRIIFEKYDYVTMRRPSSTCLCEVDDGYTNMKRISAASFLAHYDRPKTSDNHPMESVSMIQMDSFPDLREEHKSIASKLDVNLNDSNNKKVFVPPKGAIRVMY